LTKKEVALIATAEAPPGHAHLDEKINDGRPGVTKAAAQPARRPTKTAAAGQGVCPPVHQPLEIIACCPSQGICTEIAKRSRFGSVCGK
jgi:hypothetical protein